MSFKEPSPQTLEALAAVAQAMGGDGSFHLLVPRICDHCKDEGKEAFPYYVRDAQGRPWEHLCNSCFEALGCAYPDLYTCADCEDAGHCGYCFGMGYDPEAIGWVVCPVCDGRRMCHCRQPGAQAEIVSPGNKEG